MNLTLPVNVHFFGNPTYRGQCPRENVEQASLINRIRREYPDTWGRLMLHPRNEGLVERGQFSAVIKHRAEGMAVGAADVVIPAARAFVCEIKRQNPQLSKWQDGQLEYLTAAANVGAFACVALGAVAGWEAFETWLERL